MLLPVHRMIVLLFAALAILRGGDGEVVGMSRGVPSNSQEAETTRTDEAPPSETDNLANSMKERALGGQLYRAEVGATLRHCTVETKHEGFTGPGYVDMRKEREASIEWRDVRVDTSGQYDIKLRYASKRRRSRKCNLTVDGFNVGALDFPTTGAWESWRIETIDSVWLSADRSNAIRLQALAKGPIVDSMEIVGVASSPSTPENSHPQESTGTTFQPGNLTKTENGLLLSSGLRSSIIARAGRPVSYSNGSSSIETFHYNPDGAATITAPVGDGWAYVSNSELYDGNGGVGAIYFNGDGSIFKYEMILKNTTRNCSGGKTPWKTFISCEEHPDGIIYEVDPFGGAAFQGTGGSYQQTSMANGSTAGAFESVACDNRDPRRPRFFVTKDHNSGDLRRFTPDNATMDDALATGNYTRVLSTEGTIDYLVLQPNPDNGGKNGTYLWTSDIAIGQVSANHHFQNCEGIAVNEPDGTLIFVSKRQKEVFTLSLDTDTYEKTSTEVGTFDGTPDQIKLVPTADDRGHMWFVTEEAGDGAEGIFGRDDQRAAGGGGDFFELLKLAEYRGETAGIAFSPDLEHLYFSSYRHGIVFDVTREDGLKFGDEALPLARL